MKVEEPRTQAARWSSKRLSGRDVRCLYSSPPGQNLCLIRCKPLEVSRKECLKYLWGIYRGNHSRVTSLRRIADRAMVLYATRV